jgi:hypothetical protein
MLKFFRRIRRKLLAEKKISNYLIYSIGEILLVVLGILIALQINSWNEDRLEKKLEIKLLQSLKSDLNGSINDMSKVLEVDSIMVIKGEQLIQILEDEASTYQDSMDQLFGWIEIWDPFDPRMMTYENLKSLGYSVISNDTLRSNIIYLFDNAFARHKTASSTVVSILPNQVELIFKHLRTGQNVFQKKPNDFEKIKKDEEYLNYLTWIVAARKSMMNASRFTLKQIVSLRNRIDQELDSRSKPEE